MEKRIEEIFRASYSDITEKWYSYMESHKPGLDDAYNALQDAIKGGDTDAIKEAKAVYERTAKNITVNNDRFQAISDELAEKIAHVNEIAVDYVNDNMAKVYAINYNALGEQNLKGYSFSLTNEQAVKNLARAKKLMLPNKTVNVAKDMRWNEKYINSQMMQGILQGESIPQLSKRILPEINDKTDFRGKTSDEIKGLLKRNIDASKRNARTMTTAAENKGRQDSFQKASDDGVIISREWIATGDDRTREWHSELDGVEVAIDEPWENEYGSIMYPGDPDADPANVYNCRCSIRAHVMGFKKWDDEGTEADIEEEESKLSDNLTFADGISEEQQELISELYDEYDSRLESINKGAERAAGDVDITGTTMRLSSKDPSVALHEFAHTLANTDADKYGLTHDESFWKEIKRIRREYLNNVKYDTNKWISSYEHSHKKIDEFMVESFTLAKGKEMGIKLPSKYGQDLTYANKVLEVVDKYFRRKHK